MDADSIAVSIINFTCLLCWGVDTAIGLVVRYKLPGIFVEMEHLLEEHTIEEYPENKTVNRVE